MAPTELGMDDNDEEDDSKILKRGVTNQPRERTMMMYRTTVGKSKMMKMNHSN